jgi:hypothetical protein
LHEVGGVRVLEASPARKAVDNLGIEVEKLPPGVGITGILDANQQAGSRQGKRLHSFFLVRRQYAAQRVATPLPDGHFAKDTQTISLSLRANMHRLANAG